MNRQQVKELLPIIQAFAEGKTIQGKWHDGTWVDINKEDFDNLLKLIKYGQVLRVKPEPTYRPFKDAKECWNEMLKHQPFGWVKTYHGQFFITGLKTDRISFGINDNFHSYNYMFKEYTFADDTPFGIKE